jgi:hypothetical protein
MNRIISYKAYRLLYAVIITLTVSFLAIAQTQRKIIESQSQQIIQEKPSAGHHIAGTVIIKPDNQPVAKAIIQLTEIGNKLAGIKPFTSKTFTDEQGIWRIANVPDGDYLIIVDPAVIQSSINNNDKRADQENSTAGAKFVARSHKIKMSGVDIDNLDIHVNKGGIITGKVVMDTGEPLPKDLIVLPEQTAETDRSPGRFAQVQTDGSFILEGVPVGGIRLKVVVYAKPKEYYTKTARVDGIDLLSDTLSIEDGSKVNGVHIVFAKVIEK